MLARLFAPQAMVGPAGYVRDVERVYGGKTECLKLSILEIDQSAEACQDVKTRMQPRMQRVPTVSTWVCLKICDPKIHGVIIDFPARIVGEFPIFRYHTRMEVSQMWVPPNHPSKIRIRMDVRILPLVHHRIW